MDLERDAEEKAPLVYRASLEERRDSDVSDLQNTSVWDNDPLRPQTKSFEHNKPRSTLSCLQGGFRHLRSRVLFLSRTPNESLRTSGVKSTFSRSHIASLFGRSLLFLLPSFLQARITGPSDPRKAATVHQTAWLDGIRGFAALFVFFYHFAQRIWEHLDYGWGAQHGDHHYTSFFRLPIVRIVYAGPAAVSIFFVVSGFALSVRPISQMWKQDRQGLMSTLSSATLRRPLRLFLPCFASTFLDFLAVRAGWFAYTRPISSNSEILTGIRPPHIGRRGTFLQQLWDWAASGAAMIDMFRWDLDRYGKFEDDYDLHLWTIPIEFRCSLILFLTQVAFCNLSSTYRMLLQTMLTVLSLRTGRWDMMLFWGGGVLAEVYQLYLRFSSGSTPSGGLRRRIWSGFLFVNFMCGLFLISYPRLSGNATYGYAWLTSKVPSDWREWNVYHFFQGIGSFQLIASVGCSPYLSQIFASPLPRYLGQISFALYLVHGVVNHTAGYLLFGFTYNLFGGGNDMRDALRFLVALVLELGIVVWTADIFYRVVDVNTVRFARWLEGKMKAA